MNSKLIHITDLSGRDRFYFCFENGIEIVQQEINQLEYSELKSAEQSHFQNTIKELKHKYRILEQEQKQH